jgi:hypothetical protein
MPEPAGRRAAATASIVGVALLLTVVGCTAERAAPRPSVGGATTSTAAPSVPRLLLAGVPLAGPTGLELLVSGNPPRLLDVDAGTSREVAGLPAGSGRVSWVRPVGRDAVIVSEVPGAGGEVFLLRLGAVRASALGRATDAIPSRDGRGLWLWRHRDRRGCTLREVGLDGRQRRPARRVDCDAQLGADTDLGLLVRTDGSGTALVDPDGGRGLAGYPVVHVVTDDVVLWGGDEVHQGPFTLTDRQTGARRRVPRPTRVGRAETGSSARTAACWRSSSPTRPLRAARRSSWTCGCWTSGPAAGGSSPACRCWPRSSSPAWPGPATAACCCSAASTGSATRWRRGGRARTGWSSAASGSRPTVPARTRSSHAPPPADGGRGAGQSRRDSDRAISGTRDRQ